ncbi:MAG: hypothetical protein ABUS79_06165 [Pseudomonadota bacterium]
MILKDTVRAATMAALACSALLSGCATTGGGGSGTSTGNDEKPAPDEKKAMSAIGEKVKGHIVWSSSRVGNHDLFVMNTDGSHIRQITKGEPVDWFPRFAPDGKRILFTRSKKGWVFERDANTDGKWDIYTVGPEGGDETKVVDNASWGSWVSNDEIVYARSTRIYRRPLSGEEETLLLDSTTVPELDGALVQQPEMSRDGKFIAITLRGSKRETGIWDIDKKTWRRSGEGCQINWDADGKEIYWVHPTGNGGSRVLHMPVTEGKPSKSDAEPDALTLIDIPGRRSHEYFPQLSRDGKWLVWAATQRGHDHDIADYEIYLWEVGADPETATRLTYHSGNDRWPDIFLGENGGGGGGGGRGDGDGAKAGKPAAGDEAKGSADKAKAATKDDESPAADEGTSHGTKAKAHKKKHKKGKR